MPECRPILQGRAQQCRLGGFQSIRGGGDDSRAISMAA